MLKYGDLYSGIGCVAQALWGLGIPFSYEFACDIDKHCKANLLHNFDVKQFHDDVKEIKSLPKVDLFTAGFPCQPFSTSNRINGGEKHAKHDLFTETIRCLRLCDPEVFILENVASLTHKNHLEYFNYIKQTLDGLDYNWDYKVINSKDYGTPQSRNRVYFIGCRNSKPKFPEPEPIIDKLYDILDTGLPLQPFVTKSKNQKWKQLQDDVWYVDNGQCSGQFWRFYELNAQEYSYALIAGNKLYLCKKQDEQLFRRCFTIDEVRQLQRIHEHFENICSDNQFYKQIGNGMDVSMMEKLIRLNVNRFTY